MQRTVSVNLGNMVLSLSDAMDLARLDGSGYPFHCGADELSTGSRILVVADMFTALSEDRPFRKAMSRPEITGILTDLSERALLDPGIIGLVLKNYDEIIGYVWEKKAEARDFYERRFASP